MLKKVIITNYLGETAEYKIEGVQSDDASGLLITSVDGLGPVKANINMMDLATTDGQLYNSARLSGRNIVIKALFTDATSIEDARLLSYKHFPIKSKVNIKVVTDNRTAETDGYVESNEPDIFSEREGCQISILCENPYFDGGKIGYTFGNTIPLFKFAFGNESLDEPLIKLSEEAEVTDERRIIYDGDADTGVEIEVSAPSDDILDTFKVTGIEITGNDGKKIGIDTSKMVNQVPNTSPTNAKRSECSFIMDDHRCKYIPIIPEPVTYAYPVFYKNEYHCFYSNGSDSFLHHMKLNSETRKWERLEDTTCLDGLTISTSWIVCLDDVIYRWYWSAHRIYRFNDQTNNWDIALRYTNDESADPYGHIAVAYNHAIHCFDVVQRGSSRVNVHHIFNGVRYYEASDSESMRNALGSSYLFGSASLGFSAMVLVYNNEIHILGGSIGISGGVSDKHVVFNGAGWSDLTNDKLPETNSFYLKTAVVYHDKIHFFSPSTIDGVEFKHTIWDYQNGWTGSYDTPYGFGSKETTNIVADSDYMYLLGSPHSDSAYQYTEEANNIKLIENDRLVINTNKGKKSITLYRDDNKYNVINALEKGSTWFQLHRGVNRLSYSAETGADDMQITISTNKWYEGV